MDWRDLIVFEQITDELYWVDIIKSHFKRDGFYNIKILKKEDEAMFQNYLDFLAELQNEMHAIQTTDIETIVDRRVAEFREKARAEENTKKAEAEAKKQAEIDAVNRIIDRLRASAESVSEETENQNNEEE